MNQFLEYIKNSLTYLRNKLLGVVNIQDDTDVAGTINSIENGIHFKGATVWILICAALLASIGLDVNSVAVIIGAMLISPLMSPILGIGLAIGISDKEMLINSLKNFSIAIIVSLTASSVYWLLTPLGIVTNEMLARTTPTLLDVAIATFGGIAGIVANSRKEKSTAIPGVAIATALMPPLCTAGYGIATFNLTFFLGAFYLFFINAVFISLSTFAVVRILNFPVKQILDPVQKYKRKVFILVFVLLVLSPSIYLLFGVVTEARQQRSIKLFLDENLKNDKYEAINYELLKSDSGNTLKVYVIGKSINAKDEKQLHSKLSKYDLDDFKLKFLQISTTKSDKLAYGDMNQSVQIEIGKRIDELKKEFLESNELKMAYLQIDSVSASKIYQTAINFDLGIKTIELGRISILSMTDIDLNVKHLKSDTPIAILEFNEEISIEAKAENITKFKSYLMLALNTNDALVFEK